MKEDKREGKEAEVTKADGVTLTAEERQLVGFHLACRLEDYDKQLKKAGDPEIGRRMWQRLEEVTYTRIIPESWCGPKPAYWGQE